ncbi:hypothetical protein [Trinickia terrae]|uniref:hypothetical protein n=1 Tax=Trinickia terrae TaxID=2571161 RepID=UPI001F0D4298|nr:hypothetical protein [Trinickia terrae]
MTTSISNLSPALHIGTVESGGASGSTEQQADVITELLNTIEQLIGNHVSQNGIGSPSGTMPGTVPGITLPGQQAFPQSGVTATPNPALTTTTSQLPAASPQLAMPNGTATGTTPPAANNPPAAPANPAATQQPCAASPDPTMAQFATQMPNDQTKRPPGDTRTAQQIIDDNPLLKNLGNQSGIKDQLNKFVGGNMANDPDQAYKAAALLTYIKSSANSKGDTIDKSEVGNGKIDGFTKDGDARHGTEAGLLQDVVGGGGHPGGGWAHLQQTDHKLDVTSDTHVNADGTNKDNLQWGFEQAGKYIGAFFKGVGKSVLDIITKGKFNPVSAVLTVVKDVGTSEAKTAIENSSLGQSAKDTANKVFGILDDF